MLRNGRLLGVIFVYLSAFLGDASTIAVYTLLLPCLHPFATDSIDIVNYLLNFVFDDHFVSAAVTLYFIDGESHVVQLLLHHEGVECGRRILIVRGRLGCILEECHTNVYFFIHFLSKIQFHLVQDVLNFSHHLFTTHWRLNRFGDGVKRIRRAHHPFGALPFHANSEGLHSIHLCLCSLDQ